METSGEEADEPVFLLAEECESLFNKAHSSFSTSFSDYRFPFEDCRERFLAWVAFMGVFSKSSLCLDRRLRHHPDLQDLVIRYLDIIKTNLSYLNDLMSAGVNTIQDGECEARPSSSESETGESKVDFASELDETLHAMDSSLDSLNRMGIAMRQSSRARSAFSGPGDMSAFNAFKEVSYLLVQYLYPDAGAELQDHLSVSMAVCSDSVTSRRTRQDQLNSRRPQPTTGPLPYVGTGRPLLTTTTHANPSDNPGNSQMRAHPRIEALKLRSEPTSVNRSQYQLLLNAPTAVDEGASSVVVGLIDYPSPPQATGTHFTCQWCFASLDKKHSGGRLWRAHVDNDLKPYVCISEECAEQIRSFPTPEEWQDHMRSHHGANWYRDVYPPLVWKCAFCPYGDRSFTGAESLEEHMKDCHAEIFMNSDKESIISSSRVKAKRRPDFCPLCCRVVDQDEGDARVRAARAAHQKESDPAALKRQHGTSTLHDIAKRARTGLQNSTLLPDNEGSNQHADQPASNANAARKGLMERHIKEHLQFLMIWTLRLLSVHKPEDDTQSFSSETTESIGASTRHWAEIKEFGTATIVSELQNIGVDDDEPIEVDDAYDMSNNDIPDSEHNLDSLWLRVPTPFHQPPEELSQEEEGELPQAPGVEEELTLCLDRADSPQLDAIRSEGLPDLGQGLYSIPGQVGGTITRRLSDASSSITVLDRGDDMYARTYPEGFNNSLLAAGPTEADDAPLWKRLTKLQCPSSDGRLFFPRGTIEHFFTLDVIFKIIKEGVDQGIISPSLSPTEIEQYTRKIKGTPRKGKQFIRTLSILVLISREQDIIHFVNLGINDSKLPLKVFQRSGNFIEFRDSLDTPIEVPRTWSISNPYLFEQEQWSVLTPWFSRRERRHAPFYELHENVILPWTYNSGPMTDTGSGTISCVEIHPNNHDFDVGKSYLGSFAIKQLKISAYTWNDEDRPSDLKELKAEFRHKIEILNRFGDSRHAHLVSLLAAYRQRNECCLIFHWAKGNLDELWRSVNPGLPLLEPKLRWMLEQSRGIADGIRQIHVYSNPEDLAAGDRFYGLHGDIKPQNILYFMNDDTRITGSNYTNGTLVITDFGLLRCYSTKTGIYSPELELGMLAMHTYGPPEYYLTEYKISRSYDIWSLGCVLTEFVAWYLGGWDLVSDFGEKRLTADSLINRTTSDRFFEVVRAPGEPSSGEIYVRVKFEVQDFVNDLHAHKNCSELVHRLLDFIMDKILVVEAPNIAPKRAKADDVYQALNALCSELDRPGFTIQPAPRRKKEPVAEPPAVKLPLSVRVRTIFNNVDRVSQLREHTGQLVPNARDELS